MTVLTLPDWPAAGGVSCAPTSAAIPNTETAHTVASNVRSRVACSARHEGICQFILIMLWLLLYAPVPRGTADACQGMSGGGPERSRIRRCNYRSSDTSAF